VLEIASENQILLQFLTPNASHFLQPLDDKLFAIFKRELEKRCEEYKASLSLLGLTAKHTLASVMPSAFDVAFTPTHIQDSWSNVGIWPFHPEIIKERALLYTSKSQEDKYTKKVDSLLKKQAFEVVMKMNKKAKETILLHLGKSFEKQAVLPKKPCNMKQNSAVNLYSVTKGSHGLHIEHKKVKKAKEAEKEAEKDQRKLEQQERKRKREEEAESKERQKREKLMQKEEEMKKFRNRACKAQLCKFVYDLVLF
jgi:hypothetical protein